MLHTSQIRDKAISSVVPGSYEESHFLDLWLPGVMKAYSVIAKGVGELHCKRTHSAVLSSQWCEGAAAICQIRMLCKTTKSPGDVTFQVCSLGSVEHVDRFLGMAGTSLSCKI